MHLIFILGFPRNSCSETQNHFNQSFSLFIHDHYPHLILPTVLGVTGIPSETLISQDCGITHLSQEEYGINQLCLITKLQKDPCALFPLIFHMINYTFCNKDRRQITHNANSCEKPLFVQPIIYICYLKFILEMKKKILVFCHPNEVKAVVIQCHHSMSNELRTVIVCYCWGPWFLLQGR